MCTLSSCGRVGKCEKKRGCLITTHNQVKTANSFGNNIYYPLHDPTTAAVAIHENGHSRGHTQETGRLSGCAVSTVVTVCKVESGENTQ